jgi:hypothetical protein
MQGPRDGRFEATLENFARPATSNAASTAFGAPWVAAGPGGIFQVTAAQFFVAVDTTGAASPQINLPVNPSDGQPFVVFDRNGLSANNPIRLVAVAPIAIADPNTPGAYAQVVELQSGASVTRLKYETATHHWLLW